MERSSHILIATQNNQPYEKGTPMTTKQKQPAPPPKIEPPDDEVADFFEPVTFDWDEDVFQAREAARRYSEQIKNEF